VFFLRDIDVRDMDGVVRVGVILRSFDMPMLAVRADVERMVSYVFAVRLITVLLRGAICVAVRAVVERVASEVVAGGRATTDCARSRVPDVDFIADSIFAFDRDIVADGGVLFCCLPRGAFCVVVVLRRVAARATSSILSTATA
jgi:hypothetical protein